MTISARVDSGRELRFQEPDVVVAVGREGDQMKEFHCYAAVLGLASEYFEAMLSTAMKEKTNSRIEFPGKDPKEWEMFYSYVDPATSCSVDITHDNVKILLPWFHEFQMLNLIRKCDEHVSSQISELQSTSKSDTYRQQSYTALAFSDDSDSDQENDQNKKKRFQQLLDLLLLSDTYNLEKAQETAWRAMAEAMSDNCDVIDFESLAILLPLLQKEGSLGLSWEPIRQFLPHNLDVSNLNVVSEGTTSNLLLTHLVLGGIKSQRIKDDATKFMKKALQFPQDLYVQTQGKSYAASVRSKLHNIIDEKWKNNGFVKTPQEAKSQLCPFSLF